MKKDPEWKELDKFKKEQKQLQREREKEEDKVFGIDTTKGKESLQKGNF